MSKTLVIAEKPSVAQDIVRALTPVAGKFEKLEDHFEKLEPMMLAGMSDALGRKVGGGDASLVLAGGPGVKLANVSIAEDPRFGGGDFATARSAALRLDPGALLRGQIRGDVHLDGPTVYLLRDPRDVLMSIWSFNRKRGTNYFSVIEGETNEAFALRFAEERKLRLRMILELAAHDEHACVVRYEDMATDLVGVAAKLSDRLGVQLDAKQVLSQQNEFSHHMSSAGPEASMQRWRREMAPDVQKIFTDVLGNELQALGYRL